MYIRTPFSDTAPNVQPRILVALSNERQFVVAVVAYVAVAHSTASTLRWLVAVRESGADVPQNLCNRTPISDTTSIQRNSIQCALPYNKWFSYSRYCQVWSGNLDVTNILCNERFHVIPKRILHGSLPEAYVVYGPKYSLHLRTNNTRHSHRCHIAVVMG